MDLERKIKLLHRVSLSNNSTSNEVKIAKKKIKLFQKKLAKTFNEGIAAKKIADAALGRRVLQEEKEHRAKSKAESEALLAAWKNNVAREPLDVEFFNQNNHWQGKK